MTQYARPDSDIVVGAWVTAPLWPNVDEVTPSDVDYIQTPATSTCELGLSNVSDPQSSASHVINVRAQRTASGGTCTAYLMQGAVQKASFAVTIAAEWNVTTYTLTSGEADSITDYTDLRLKFTGIRARISWTELGVPDVSGNVYNESLSLAASGVISPAHTLTIDASLSLQAAGYVGPESAGSVYNPVLILASIASISHSSDAVLLASVALDVAAAAVASGGMAYDSSVALTAAAALAAAAALTTENSVGLPAFASIAAADTSLLIAAISLLSEASVVPQSQAVIEGGAALSAQAGIATQAQVFLNAILALASMAGTDWIGEIAAAGVFYETVAMAANAGLSAQSIATLEALTSLAATSGLVTSSTALIEAALILLTVASIGADADVPGSVELGDMLITILRRRRGR